MMQFPNVNKIAPSQSFDDIGLHPVAAKPYKFAASRQFSQRNKWKAAQLRDGCAKPDVSAQKRRVSMEMQPYVITVDDSLASTATMPTAAAVPEGRRISNGVRDYCP